MTAASDLLEPVRLLLLTLGFAAAAVFDLRSREVDDRLWQFLGVLGIATGAVLAWDGGLGPLLLWLAVGAFALEHLFPWDDALGERGERLVLPIEVGAYLGVLLLVGSAAIRWGVGDGSVPIAVIALLATVVLSRGLFELGVLYGGADAKAVIVAGTLVPVFAVPLLYSTASSSLVLSVLPFAVTLLTNAAVLSLAVPISVAFRNLRRGQFRFPSGFTGYALPVGLLPRRFVWVRDSHVGEDGLLDDVETSAEDQSRRASLARDLAGRGVREVWVSPQIPFVVLLAAGAYTALLAGNLLLDLFALV